MKKTFLKSIIAGLSLWASAAMANFVAGQDYIVLPSPQKVEVPGKIEVREFFWYGCPHCHALEPHMQSWLKKLPKDVRFVRTPAPINPMWEIGARTYFVSEHLGVRQDTHLPLFEMHYQARRVLNPQEIATFFTRYKVPTEKFNAAYVSPAVTKRVDNAKKLMQAYQLSGVPAVIVNGKYMVQGADAKVPQVINFLVNKERKGK